MVADLNGDRDQAAMLMREMVETDGLPRKLAKDYFDRISSAPSKKIEEAQPTE